MTTEERYAGILDWFSRNMQDAQTELQYDSVFHLLIAVILSAQCTDKRVNMHTPEIFRKYPVPASLAEADVEDVAEDIKSITFPNSKARHLVDMARMLVDEFDGEVPSDLDRFIFASQSVQAEAMKYFIEIYRGNKFAPKTGILWWNVRDGWPVISDAVTDYYFNKKLAYWFIRNVQKNVCLMVNDPVDGCYPLVAVNDTRVPASGKVSVKDIGSGEKIFEGEYTVGANSRGLVARLPQREGQGMLLITYTGPDGECRNHYLYGNAPFDLDWYGKMLRKTGIYEIK